MYQVGQLPLLRTDASVSHECCQKNKNRKKKKKPHPPPPAPLSCQSCSGMCFVFSTGGKASASSAVHRCRLSGAGAHCHKVWRFLALLRRVHFSRLTFFILKSRMDTWNKNESQNAPNMNKKEIIHRQEKQGLGVKACSQMVSARTVHQLTPRILLRSWYFR